MHVLEPWLPDVFLTPDHNAADTAAELRSSVEIERLLNQFLRFEVEVDVVEDALAQHGINPHEFWDVVDANIDALAGRDEVLEDIDSILVMPDGSPIPTIYGRDRVESREAGCLESGASVTSSKGNYTPETP